MHAMSEFARTLQAWHAAHGRHDLPWQKTRDPYRIWLSEIMLQQTQVDSVIPYYARFLARFPDLVSLAGAPVDEVLGLWSGLGYYARARNLHKAARALMEHHGGHFPANAEAIATLPGIGRSTAAAIAAFAFDERAAILDGNVKRVLCRIFGIEGFPGEKAVENRLWALAESLLPDAGIGTYIQAQMDLGATLCTRGRPACGRCPFASGCIAHREGRTGTLPAARPRKALPHRRLRVAVICAEGRILLERRPPAGIWGGMLSLPEITDEDVDAHAWLASRFGLTATRASPLPALRHVFTHFSLDLLPVRLDTSAAVRQLHDPVLTWLASDALAGAALPTPIRRILESLDAPGALLPLETA